MLTLIHDDVRACTTCGVTKPHSEFRKGRKGGQCKSCIAARNRDWYLQTRELRKKVRNTYEIANRARRQEYHRDYYANNKELVAERNKRWRDANPARVKIIKEASYQKNKEQQYRDHLRRRVGVTSGAFQELVSQGLHCHICGNTPERRLHVDHCHTTGVVRGLLCQKCNQALGFSRDSVEILSRWLHYLRSPVDLAALGIPQGDYQSTKAFRQRHTSVYCRLRLRRLPYNALDVLLKHYDFMCPGCLCHIDKSCPIDHCHTTGVVRGLLCTRCNSGIGLLGDHLELVEPRVKSAIIYLTGQ